MNRLPSLYSLSAEVARARAMHMPIVALESAVITHGLPYPENVHLARQVEEEVRAQGCTPATIAVLDGKVHVGIDASQLERLGAGEGLVKISARDFAPAIAKKLSGGTTVAGSLAVARAVGFQVFATGGIGGVHRQEPAIEGGRLSVKLDISADLALLGATPMIVVCSGAKAILDIPATLEALETLSVPVIGYQCDEFPAFYSSHSGLKTSVRADSPEEAASIAQIHWQMGLKSAVLVAAPLPEEAALSRERVEGAIQKALEEANERGIRGQEITPFLLRRVSELTDGASLRVNLALLRRNARIAALIARALSQYPSTRAA